ncbi:hypothetical protein U9M48_007987 [Paspalum notatum var. saurae]|uniref:Homeobox domain-containing protein n=1 Tax=Paspalum notatum var. saurae TaxID=547442 RepID=A0AAQ3WCS3_PASNO
MEMMVNATDQEQRYGDGHLGLGLSLSLSIATAAAPVEPAPAPRPISVVAPPVCSLPAPPLPQAAQWWNGAAAGLFFSPSAGTMDPSQLERKPPPAACHDMTMPFLRGIDVNRAPPGETRPRGASCSEDEEPGASSPNSTLSSLSGKRGAPARSSGEVDRDGGTPRAAGGGGGSDDEDSGAGSGGSRKKLRLSKDQAAVLEESFKEHNTLNPKQKAALAKQLNLKPRQVEVWFQNRRARTKLKQTEVDCEFLKRCCETLTEENRRLQREVAELRALKLVAPHHYARMPPPTTLTICPSCERLAAAAPPAADEAAGRVGRGGAAPAPTGPWGPVPVRPVFVDGPARRSS